MTIRNLPGAPEGRPRSAVRWDISARAFARWDAGVRAADDDADRSISIYDVIGYDYWTGDGVTAKRIAGALRSLGKGPVTVNVNSPGGDLFEGLAIYNLLREHEGEVTVKVLGLAASAASMIAMAGDTIQIARAGFFMVHNAWVIAMGNRHDLREIGDWLEPFDAAMADIYVARTGQEAEAVAKLMDAESWIGGSAAIEQGFADE
ncbi:MAG TPA: head maturation protease, ClpP-related, partial [Zeimonas sp.]|nr:head maturation protease, ClpP-related [Zeimonas sp.]